MKPAINVTGSYRLYQSQATFNGQEKSLQSSISGPINYPVIKLCAVNNRAQGCSYHHRRLYRHVLPPKKTCPSDVFS